MNKARTTQKAEISVSDERIQAALWAYYEVCKEPASYRAMKAALEAAATID